MSSSYLFELLPTCRFNSLLIVCLFLLFLQGCAALGVQQTIPLEERVQSLVKSYSENDIDSRYALYCPAFKKEISLDRYRIIGRPLFKRVRIGKIEQIDNEHAKVEILYDMLIAGFKFNDSLKTFDFILVDGQWYIDYIPKKNPLTP